MEQLSQQTEQQWAVFLQAMLAGATALQPTVMADIGYPIGIAPVEKPSSPFGNMMGGMGGMMGGRGGGSGAGGTAAAGSMGGGSGAGRTAAAGSMGGGVGFAEEGAAVHPGETWVVGERGPEVFVPDRAGVILPTQGGGSPDTAPTSTGDQTTELLRRALIQQMLQNDQTPSAGQARQSSGFVWQYLIPGFAVGAAKRQQMESAKEEIDLRRRQFAGQEAQQKLARLELLRKSQREAGMEKLAPVFGALQAGQDTLTDAQISELEKIIVEELVRQGSPEAVQKFMDARTAQKRMRQIARVMQSGEGAGTVPGPTPTPTSVSGETPASAPGAIPSTGNALYQQDRIQLATLEQQLAQEEQRVRQLAPFATTKEGKEAWQAARERSNDLHGRISKLRDRMAFAGHPVEQITGTPLAYLTGPQMQAGSEAIFQRELRKARETQAEGLAVAGQKAYDAAIAKAKVELENAPLDASTQDRVAQLDVMIQFVNDILRLRQNNFTGKLASPLGQFREFTGNISTDEVQFRRLLEDMQDLLKRSRSGQATTAKEDDQLRRILPTTAAQPNVFIDAMLGFGQAVEKIRDARLQAATTPRGKYLENAPRVQPPEGLLPSTMDKPIESLTPAERAKEIDQLKKFLGK